MIAEFDWGTALTAGTTVLVTGLTIFGATIKVIINYLNRREESQRKHETAIMQRVEQIANNFDESVREGRRDYQKNIDLLMDLSKDTVKTIAMLEGKIADPSWSETIVQRITTLVIAQVQQRRVEMKTPAPGSLPTIELQAKKENQP